MTAENMMEFKNLKFAKEENIGILTLSRPKTLNALSTELLLELNQAVETISKDETIHVLVVTGDGKAFVAGADITDMKNFDSIKGLSYAEFGSEIFRNIERLKIPTIAAVNGFALGGGCELAMSCDLRIASDSAKF
ncbi:MAG: enoyl-CoA hydratase-related protein, partial [Leptospirales bacterium]|nr:enoyl-CoA hydratase-related protein [Leptospirales bacterium]